MAYEWINVSNVSSGLSQVDVYTAGGCAGLLVTGGLMGCLLNIALLLASRTKYSVRTLHYGLHYVLALTHTFVCGIWLPLHVTQLLYNLHVGGITAVVCYLSMAFYSLGMALSIFLVFFLAIQRLYQLSSLPKQNLRQVVLRGLIISTTAAAVTAAAMCIELPWNVDYKVCSQGLVNNASMGHLWFSVASILFTVIYTLLLVVTLIILWIATLAVRHKMRQMLRKDETLGKSLSSEQPSAVTSSSRKDSVSDCQHSSSSAALPSKQLMFVEPKKNDEEDDEEDDEMFEMKMRMRAQKASSGRRHTVANIGLGDSLFGFGRRRGSLEDNRPKTNYNYVRKWSVDITALQDQLENPKLMCKPLPFGDLSNLKKGSGSIKTVKEKLGDCNEGSSIVNESIAEEHELPQAKPEHVSFTTDDTDNDEPEPAESDPLASKTATDPPAIVVVNGNSPRSHNNRVDFAGEVECNRGDDAATIARYGEEVLRTSKCVLFVLVTLLCLLPYTCMQVLQPVMEPHLNRNLSWLAMAIVAVTLACFHPPLLVWMDPHLQVACKRLRTKLTSWKCVCYCNIGKGKQCFARPEEQPTPNTVIT